MNKIERHAKRKKLINDWFLENEAAYGSVCAKELGLKRSLALVIMNQLVDAGILTKEMRYHPRNGSPSSYFSIASKPTGKWKNLRDKSLTVFQHCSLLNEREMKAEGAFDWPLKSEGVYKKYSYERPKEKTARLRAERKKLKSFLKLVYSASAVRTSATRKSKKIA